MSDVFLSPTIRTKTLTIDAVNKIRHGSPKLHEVLRQRCRERMRERRRQLFNKRRIGVDAPSEDVQETLTNIVRKEFNDLMYRGWKTNSAALNSIFLSLQEFEEALNLEAEIISEEEEWIVEEYNRALQCEEEHLAREVVFCPICQINGLEEIPGFVCCSSCNLQIPTQLSLADFKNKILESANAHSLQCIRGATFSAFLVNNNIALYLTCELCSSFSPVFGEGPI